MAAPYFAPKRVVCVVCLFPSLIRPAVPLDLLTDSLNGFHDLTNVYLTLNALRKGPILWSHQVRMQRHPKAAVSSSDDSSDPGPVRGLSFSLPFFSKLDVFDPGF